MRGAPRRKQTLNSLNTEFTVKNGSSMSHIRKMEKGTPQGSSLSGLLFCIYINNVPNLFNYCQCILYADDLVLWYSSTSISEIQEKLQSDLNQLLRWCHSSAMKINVCKTKSMIITPPRKSSSILNIKIESDIIEQTIQFRYLGVIIDEKLSWNEQFASVTSKMTQRTYLINRHKNSLSQKWLQILITSIVVSVLDYCLPAWGNLSKLKYARLDAIMFKALKIIIPNSERQLKNKLKLFEKVNWLTAAERYEFSTLSFVHKAIMRKSSTLSINMKEFFIKIPQSERNTRNKECFVLPRMNTEYGKSAPYYQTIKIWNSLPFEIQTCESSTLFEEKLKELLLRCRKNVFLSSQEKRIINRANCQ
jgi:hypothetical protein